MRLIRLVVLALTSCALAVPTAAQVPDTGLIGVGGNFGVFFPDETQEKAVTFDGQVDWYLTPRISVRGLLGWTSPGFENRTEDHFRQVRLQFNGVYNWELQEFERWHPYVTAGAGAYFVRQVLDGLDDPDSETRGGINLGGGAEYFTGDMTSVKGEVRFDVVSHPPGFPDASGFTITIGVKRYF